MNLTLLIFGFVFILIFILIGVFLDKNKIISALPFFIIASIVIFLMSILVVIDGVEYRTGHNETLVNNNFVRVQYTYSDEQVRDWDLDIAISIMLLLTGIIFGLSSMTLLKIKRKNKEKENNNY